MNRATKYDLVAVEKGGRLINVDSVAPNTVFREFLQSGKYLENVKTIKPEAQYGTSRFDFYIETTRRRIFIEVKGVTLEENDCVLFPDAPTERGVKHLDELAHCIGNGYDARVVFVVQMSGVLYFTPHRGMHPAFADALVRAKNAGVLVEAYDCVVSPDSLTIGKPVEVRL
jgi:sugar fermentation stimulation protein A